MRVLELFCGTKSVRKYLEKKYPTIEVISLDILSKYKPDICLDILDWHYDEYPVGYFDIIWASPECKIYSTLQQNLLFHRKWDGDIDKLLAARKEHSKYVIKVLEIIEYFQPKVWFIENPYFGAMNKIPQMNQLPSYRLDYCMFGFDYQKPTRIWTNKPLISKQCNHKKPHSKSIGSFGTQQTNLNERYTIPESLISYLLDPHLIPNFNI